MVKIGILSDIHNNIKALNAMLEVYEREECDYLVCSGDIIGIGPWPEDTVKRIMSLKNLAMCTMGNHEMHLVKGLPNEFPNQQNMSPREKMFHQWEHSRLSEESRNFIYSLPQSQTMEFEGKKVHVTHYKTNEHGKYDKIPREASPQDGDGIFSGVDADVIIYGHDHKTNITLNGKLYINTGSLGCPGEERNIARGGILTIGKQLEFRHIAIKYDIGDIEKEMEDLDMPAREEILKFFYGK